LDDHRIISSDSGDPDQEPAAWKPPSVVTPPSYVPAPVDPAASRLWLHAVLFASTFVTLSLTGGFFWAGVMPTDGSGFLTLRFWTGAFVTGVPYGLWVIAILGAHEMGHYLACRYYGIPATLPFFIPAPPIFVGSFGAVIRIKGRIPDRRALFDVAAAGPLAGFAIAFPLMIVGLLTAETATGGAPEPGTMYLGSPIFGYLFDLIWPVEGTPQVNYLIGAGWVGMLVTSLNLFPVGQLDGGHAAYAISRRLHRVLARISIGALLALMIYQGYSLRQAPAYTVWFVIVLWMRDRHPTLSDETTPLGAGRLLVGALLLLIFLMAFIPVPVIVIDG
jgi:membrane-associated protease RseP (regulator of RpoE activity)